MTRSRVAPPLQRSAIRVASGDGRRLGWSSLRIVAPVNASVDAIALALILYASGGVASGLGILLVPPVLALRARHWLPRTRGPMLIFLEDTSFRALHYRIKKLGIE